MNSKFPLLFPFTVDHHLSTGFADRTLPVAVLHCERLLEFLPIVSGHRTYANEVAALDNDTYDQLWEATWAYNRRRDPIPAVSSPSPGLETAGDGGVELPPPPKGPCRYQGFAYQGEPDHCRPQLPMPLRQFKGAVPGKGALQPGRAVI